jgi:iron complex transport system substrate-binding protein
VLAIKLALSKTMSPPQRIICLSAESADWLWRIGAWGQVVAVTAFFNQPPEARPKPRVSGFSTAKLDEIEELDPELVITFSDVQAEIAAQLMRRGFTVLGTNQRTLAEIEETLELLGRIVGREEEAVQCLQQFRQRLAPVAKKTSPRPRVYFEEWNDPLVSGIAWVGELIERAGGIDVFADLRSKPTAQERQVDPDAVRARNPEVMFASWCGRPVRVNQILSRPRWDAIEAVKNGRIHELPGDDILQPGFRLVFGYDRMKQLL